MYFRFIKTPDGTLYQHKVSKNIYIYRRGVEGKYSLHPKLTFLNQDKNKREIEVAKASITNNDGKFLSTFLYSDYDNIAHPGGAYNTGDIFVTKSHRGQSLGTILLFILAGEVMANGGKHLYLLRPVVHALGFYIKFGFHPDPGIAAGRREYRLGRIRREHPENLFAEQIVMSRDYPVWRGEINIVLDLLTNQVASRFDTIPT